MNKKLLPASIAALMMIGGINTASAASILFTGSITAHSCILDVNNSGSTVGDVDMGSISVKTLTADTGATSTPVPFTISLKECTGASSYSIEFAGNSASFNNNYFRAPNSMGSGVYYEIKDSEGRNVQPNEIFETNISKDEQSADMNFTVNLMAVNNFVNQGNFVMSNGINVHYE
ncbi:fimbrial protein [Rahnella perminowiae]|uniref:fimbrial protein n=1 Tax=Rahnella perminowiae TaxID=2816244 RepID=UPI00224B0CC1|nr:fimbrial protein [Rahnella perminowiae]MCX2942006.1 fimbrial protein [Rahnella perminowiae]